MKNILFVLIALALLISCNKDKDTGPTNSVAFEGESYALDKGYLENHGLVPDANALYSFDLWLVSNGIVVTEADISGVGNMVYIALFSGSKDELTPGTYTFTNTQASPFTFYFTLIGLDYDVANKIGLNFALVGGTVIVANDGTNYEITLNGVLVNGKSVTAYYKGPLTLFDYTV